MWCIPTVTDEFKSRMEEVLDLYARPYNHGEPVVCFDEKSKQLLEETRTALPAHDGKPLRRDYEYKRNGTMNVFMAVEPKGGHREATITNRRTAADFAREIRRLVETVYATAARVHFVLDNLNTHCRKSLEKTFGAKTADALMKRIQFHHTPKHASWLNMAEIELSALSRQALRGRISSTALLSERIRQWQDRRNRNQVTIQWKFTTKDARRTFIYDAV